MFFITIITIAVGLGLYGFYLITTIIKATGYESRSVQSERFMIGLFNIFISLFAIYTIIIIIQFNAGELFTHTNKLLGQLK